MELLKRNLGVSQKQVYTAGIIISGFAIGYGIYKVLSKEKVKVCTVRAPVERSFSQVYQQVIKQVTTVLNRTNEINGQVIKCILQCQYDLAHNDYVKLMMRVRDARRKALDQKHEYSKIVASFDQELEELMDRNLSAILAHCKIDKTYWIQAVEKWSNDSDDNKEEWQNFLVDLDEKQLDSLRDPSQKPIPLSKLKEITSFKIHTLKNLHESGLDLQSSTTSEIENDLNAKYNLIDMYIRDLVFKKFKCEEQDIVFSSLQLSDSELNTYYTFEDQFTALMRHQIMGDDSLQQQEMSISSAQFMQKRK